MELLEIVPILVPNTAGIWFRSSNGGLLRTLQSATPFIVHRRPENPRYPIFDRGPEFIFTRLIPNIVSEANPQGILSRVVVKLIEVK
jgi:hypothetical protein